MYIIYTFHMRARTHISHISRAHTRTHMHTHTITIVQKNPMGIPYVCLR